MKSNSAVCGLCKPHKRFKKNNTRAQALARRELFRELETKIRGAVTL